MTTYKTLRSYEANERRIEKARQKTIEIKNAYRAVTDWNDYLLTLKTIHLKSTTVIDWEKIKSAEKPYEPKREYKNEDYAKNQLENFKPSFLDKLFGLIPKKINNLTDLLDQAKAKDENENDANFKNYLDNLKDWEKLQEISIGVEKNQIESYKKALEYFNPFSKIGEIGNQVNINLENNFIDVDLIVNDIDVLPDYELKQTSTGKLSKTNMPKARFNELYQQHVCSCVLRVGREVFALLPYKNARVNAIKNNVNCENGNVEKKLILSVIFSKEIMQKTNFGINEPLDDIMIFSNNISFHKINGFTEVNIVELTNR